MRYSYFPLLILSLLLFNSCNEDDSFEMFPADAAIYEAVFTFNWNSTDFPTDYPSNAHFSPLIGWSHTAGNDFFKVGTQATDGIENMAETGGTSPLDDELQSLIEADEGLDRVIGSGLGSGTGTITVDIVVNKDHPEVSLVTMLAPSPDWYSGAINVLLYNEGTDAYLDTKTTEIFVYDAGTDNGPTFTSANDDTSPQVPISLFVDPPLGDGIVPAISIGNVTFTKQ